MDALLLIGIDLKQLSYYLIVLEEPGVTKDSI